jgi:uncharacterized protein (TIGR03435 family)
VKENTSADLTIRFDDQPADGYQQRNLRLASYVTYAFDIPQPSRIDGLPEWTRSTRYDITAKASTAITEELRRAMLRAVLVTRFHLTTHIENREQTIYVMTAVRADKRLGFGLTPRPDCEATPCNGGGTGRADGFTIRAVTLARLAEGMLSNELRQLVRDDTGIAGTFDAVASWRPDSAAPDSADTRPDMFTALREQLGLKLEPMRQPVDVLVIDHIERPSEN